MALVLVAVAPLPVPEPVEAPEPLADALVPVAWAVPEVLWGGKRRVRMRFRTRQG